MARRVAVVDDDESVRTAFGRLLRAAAFEALSYPSAEAYLEDPTHASVDCLVLDIELDGMSGLELNERLVASGSTTPVIFFTGHAESEARARAEATGCAGFFLKTDPSAAVLAAIRGATDRSRP